MEKPVPNPGTQTIGFGDRDYWLMPMADGENIDGFAYKHALGRYREYLQIPKCGFHITRD
jgi:hypothetical protein